MYRFISTGGLAARCARRPWVTIIVWLLLVATAVFAMFTMLGDALTAEMKFTRQPESQRGQELLEERLTGPEKMKEIVIVSSENATVDDPAFRADVERLTRDIAALPPDVVEQTVNYYQTGDESMVSTDRHSTIVPVVLAGTIDQAESNVGQIIDLGHEVGSQTGLSVMTTGMASTDNDFNEVAKSDGAKTEIIGIGMALVVLLVVFGTLVAAGLPIALAGLSILVALGITALVGQKFQMSFFVANMIVMMGLAVGIDYTLFIISRYREELATGSDRYQAIAIAGATASKSVLFSGLTVILALVGMLLIPMSIFSSLGAGAIFVVAIAMAAALTLLPAILSLTGNMVNSLKIPVISRLSRGSRDGRFWDRTTGAVMKRPLLSALAVIVALGLPALYFFQMNTGSSGIATLPDRFESKRAYMALERDFSLGLITPVEIVIDGDVNGEEVQQAMSAFNERAGQDDIFYGEPQVQVNQAGDLALISLAASATTDSEASIEAVKRLRNEYIPLAFAGSGAQVLVTGATASNVDYYTMTNDFGPVIVIFILALSFLLLMVVFRSLVVPLKAILMNLLSVGAAYGLIVLVFQKGVGAGLLGFHQVEAVEAWLPIFLFSVLFGLSMDYHVFLLGRVRERYLETGDNGEAVAFGLKSTGRIITGAALIMVAVFAGFASGELVMFQQMGFGLAVAILLDATLIRSVLVPSTMKLLGHRNWYLPRWLEWLPDLKLGETYEPPAEKKEKGRRVRECPSQA
ncbi:MAG: MMPL family transporter [Thermoleophilia bacterium]|nr:MMPL family transporter [Thermoleophilia bacterium]